MNRCPLDGELCERGKPILEYCDSPWEKYRRYRVCYRNEAFEGQVLKEWGIPKSTNAYDIYSEQKQKIEDWLTHKYRCENIEMLYALSGGPLPGDIGTKEMIDMAELLVRALRGTNQ